MKLSKIFNELSKNRMLFRAFGIPVELHFFTICFLIGILIATFTKEGLSAMTESFLNYVIVFGSITIHEFAHSLMARHYGHGTKKILLLPIGAAAILESMDLSRPKQEFNIAVIGPMASQVIALVSGFLYLWLRVPFLKQICSFNIVVFVFNMLPVFPMDGGRILRAIASSRFSTLTATKVAVGVGCVFYIGFLIGSFYLKTPMLGVIGIAMGLAGFFEVHQLNKAKAHRAGIMAHALSTAERYDKMSPKNDYTVYMFALGLMKDEKLPLSFKCVILKSILGDDMCLGAEQCSECTEECKRQTDFMVKYLHSKVVAG